MLESVEFFLEQAAIPVLEVQIFFVSAFEEGRTSVEKVENTTNTKNIARLVVARKASLVFQDLRCHKTEGSATVVLYIFLPELLLPDGEAQIGEVKRRARLLGPEEYVFRFEVTVDVAYVDCVLYRWRGAEQPCQGSA